MTNKEQREIWEKEFERIFQPSGTGNREEYLVRNIAKDTWLAACEYQQEKIDVLYSAFRNSISLGAFVCDSEQRQLAKAKELRNYEAEIIQKIKELDAR